MINREDFINELILMHNHIGISHDYQLGRLIGFHEDEVDYYYIIQYPGTWGVAPKRIYATAVGRFVSLVGRYPEPEYTYLDDQFARNGCEKVNEFIISKDTWNGIDYNV